LIIFWAQLIIKDFPSKLSEIQTPLLNKTLSRRPPGGASGATRATMMAAGLAQVGPGHAALLDSVSPPPTLMSLSDSSDDDYTHAPESSEGRAGSSSSSPPGSASHLSAGCHIGGTMSPLPLSPGRAQAAMGPHDCPSGPSDLHAVFDSVLPPRHITPPISRYNHSALFDSALSGGAVAEHRTDSPELSRHAIKTDGRVNNGAYPGSRQHKSKSRRRLTDVWAGLDVTSAVRHGCDCIHNTCGDTVAAAYGSLDGEDGATIGGAGASMVATAQHWVRQW